MKKAEEIKKQISNARLNNAVLLLEDLARNESEDYFREVILLKHRYLHLEN